MKKFGYRQNYAGSCKCTVTHWIILIYKCKLYQPMNEQNHGKRAVIIFMPTSIFVLIGHSPILKGPFQCCSLANAATQKEVFAKEQSWDVSIDTKGFI